MAGRARAERADRAAHGGGAAARRGQLLRRSRSAAARACARSRTAVRRCCRGRTTTSSSSGSRTAPSSSTWARTDCATWDAPSTCSACATPSSRPATRPLRSLDALPNNLPEQLTSFVGRERELARARRRARATRLLTLTGAGGCGKTRLAAAGWRPRRWSVSRTGCGGSTWRRWRDPGAGRSPRSARRSASGRCPAQTPLQAASRSSPVRARWSSWTTASTCSTRARRRPRRCCAALPGVTVLATSRAPLGVDGRDHVARAVAVAARGAAVEPLDAVAQSDAVRLFIERALKVRPNFAVDADNAPAIAQICHDLDGIPLAIELAAARARVLGVQQIAAGARRPLPAAHRRRALGAAAPADAARVGRLEPRAARPRTSGCCSGGWRCSPAAGRSTRSRRSARATASTAWRSSTCSPRWSTSRWSSSTSTAAACATACSRRCASTRSTASPRPASWRRCATATATRSSSSAERDRAAPGGRGPERVAGRARRRRRQPRRGARPRRDRRRRARLRLCVALTVWWKLRGRFALADAAYLRALGRPLTASRRLRARVQWARGYLLAYGGRFEEADRSELAALAARAAAGGDVDRRAGARRARNRAAVQRSGGRPRRHRARPRAAPAPAVTSGATSTPARSSRSRCYSRTIPEPSRCSRRRSRSSSARATPSSPPGTGGGSAASGSSRGATMRRSRCTSGRSRSPTRSASRSAPAPATRSAPACSSIGASPRRPWPSSDRRSSGRSPPPPACRSPSSS